MTTLPSYDIVLAGRGGQGVIFLSRIMGQAALLQGLGVRTTETHGMAMRGGSVKCFVRISDVYGPLFGSGSADLLMALHPSEAPSGLPLLKGEGTVMTNTDVVQSLPGLGEGAQHLLHRHPLDRRDVVDLRRREGVELDQGEPLPEVADVDHPARILPNEVRTATAATERRPAFEAPSRSRASSRPGLSSCVRLSA